MSSSSRAYSSTVASRGHALIGVGIAVVVAAALVARGSGVWIAAAAAAVVVATSVFVSTVRLAVGTDTVVIGWGPLSWPRRTVPVAAIVDAEVEQLSAAQVAGVGLPWRWRTSRMTVSPGPTLVLHLTTGECIRISTPRPDQAVRLIRSGAISSKVSRPGPSSAPDDHEEAAMTDETEVPRPWFGPKRVGYGIRPQTWQGWLVVLVPATLVVVLLVVLGH